MAELTPAQLRDEIKKGFQDINDTACNAYGSIDGRIARIDATLCLLAWAVDRLISMLEERDAT